MKVVSLHRADVITKQTSRVRMSNPIIYFSLQNRFSSRGFQDFYSVKRKENVEIENIKKIAAMVMIIRLFSLFHTTTSDAKRAHCSRFSRVAPLDRAWSSRNRERWKCAF